MATPQEVVEFGRFSHRCDRADFHDWLEVLEFLNYLKTFVLEGVNPEVVDIPRAELAVVVAASIQFWQASIEKGFLGMIWVIKQFVGLRASLERLRCALGEMGMIDPAGVQMKPAKTIRFLSDGEARAGSDELVEEHFPIEYLKLVPSYVITTEKDSSVEKKWREWSDYDWWIHGSMNSLLLDVPLWHQFRDEVLPDIVANRPVEGEALLNYIRNF